MATVHPSRMGLVPKDPKDAYPDRRRARSPSPSHGYDRDRRERDRERERTRDRESDDDSGRGSYRERDRDRSIERRDRRRDPDESRHRGRERDDKSRRASPEYGDYKRLASPGPVAPSMYPHRHPRDGMHERRSVYGGGSSEYLESRRSQRESSTFSIWPSSPKAPARALSPERGSSRRKSKRDRSETPSESSSDSASERRRRERKARKRARKERERRERQERKRRTRSYDDSEEENHSRESYRDQKSQSQSRPRSPSPSPALSSTEGEWIEKPVAAVPLVVTSQNSSSMPPPATILSRSQKQVEEDSDDDSDMEIGPQPLMKMTTSKKVDERAYGGALLRGEGSAMAAFLKDDTQTRIPRRGEIGLTSDEIAQFEAVGYVMSGSRHKRMNAVRMRKENQVISAEEKRGILKLQREERERREAILREEFSELVQEKLKGPEAKQIVT